MSPLARSLLALAAAALLLGACAEPLPQCTTVVEGSVGTSEVIVSELSLDQADSVIDLPSDDACGPLEMKLVGVEVTACDPYEGAAAPRVEPLDLPGGHRVRITCAMTDGQQCPQGIAVTIRDRCDNDIQ
ncbi:hypothetical protein MSG28_001868 [Choristoneura fumiferana]|uniref:Uncharacterized protein n=1 Tax=Choristoneura fumiferana TaxID=7141 RepID=A0ACC0JSX4_CHOFU|nr:hypothetical protein MSG28_001868 [Choristoneura fumiferana]